MRIDRLELAAFGPFTGQVLEMQGGAPGGVHVIYGPNEAGKSTSLRAVTALLFGIPHHTVDAHLHAGPRLSLSAELSDEGRRLSMTRLKKRKDDLRDADGQPLDPQVLADMLGHLDASTFTRRFGLDQPELERGAEALLGGAETGLFASGTAGSTVRSVLDSLEQECDQLYRPRASTRLLNKALSAHAEASRVAKQSVRPPQKWLEQKQAYDEALAEAARLSQRRSEVRAEHVRLSHLHSLLSELGRLDQIERDRTELEGVPRLPADASQRRLQTEKTLREAELASRRYEEDLAEVDSQLAALPDLGSVADAHDEQATLQDELGKERSARGDLPKRRASLRASEQGLCRALRRLGHDVDTADALESAERLIPSAAQSKRIQSLLTEQAALEQKLAHARDAARLAEQELAALAKEDDAAPRVDTSFLQVAVSEASEQSVAVARLNELEESIQRQQSRIETQRKVIGLGGKSCPANAERTTSSVSVRSQAWRKAESERAQLAGLHADDEVAERELRARLQEFIGSRDIPTEERLQQARAKRDALLVDLVGGQTDEQAFRSALVEADDIADRLRREAHRLAELHALQQQLAGLEARKAAHAERLESARSHLQNCMTAALAPFSELGLRVSSPEELEHAARQLQELTELEEQQASDERVRRQMAVRLDRLRTNLLEALGALPEKLRPAVNHSASSSELLATGRRLLEEQRLAAQRAQRVQERKAAAEQSHRQAQQRASEASAHLANWEIRFADASAGLAGGQPLDPNQAQDVLAELTELREELSEARGLRRRIGGIERDSEEFAKHVRRSCERHAPDLVNNEPLDAAVELLERMAAATRARDERLRLLRSRDKLKERLGDARTEEQSSRAELEQLMKQARVDSPDALPEVERRSLTAVELDTEHQNLVRSLQQKAEGRPLESLRSEARDVSHNQLKARIADLEDEREKLEDDFRAAERDKEGYLAGLRKYGSEDVAIARQRANDRAAEARSLLRRFVTLRTAQLVLRQQMSHYADRFAGPIARRAGELFSRLTLGRYQKLSIGVGENTIRMVRGDQELEVSQLSRGTRAQLYLALRLASLVTHFESHSVIPLVLDDLFVDFDDDRATAAFEVLGELAQHVQILYFTHLGRDLEAARNGVPAQLLYEHRIGVS